MINITNYQGKANKNHNENYLLLIWMITIKQKAKPNQSQGLEDVENWNPHAVLVEM